MGERARFPRPRREDDPPKLDPYGQIYRIKGVTKQRFLVLSERVYGFWGHWIRGHMFSCADPRSECEHCGVGSEPRWKGYLHCQSLIDASETRFVELTHGARDSLKMQISPDQSLRGHVIELWRTSTLKEAHLRVQLYPRTVDLSHLPEAIDPTPHVTRLWGAVPAAAQERLKKFG